MASPEPLSLIASSAVDDQVQQHLLHLDPIAADHHRQRAQFEYDFHVLDQRLASHQAHDVPDNAIEVEPLHLDVSLVDQASHAVHDLASTLIVRDNVSQNFAELDHVRIPAGNQPLSHLRVGQDRGQRLVQLVG